MTRPEQGRIVVNELTKVFTGNIRAVDRLTFTVEPGSVTGFLGPNGAGKTTTLRMALGLVNPTSGSVTIGGLPYRDIPNPIATVGAALESSGFHPARTGRNHLRILCVASGIPESRADAMLQMVGLGDSGKRKVRGYSLGMRQRLALAAALLGDPKVLLLDEPANGLDPDGIRWLRGFFRHLAAEGRTVLVSSHQLGEVSEVADRVVILNRGALVRAGSIDELTAGTLTVLARSPEASRLAAAVTAQGGQVQQVDPATVQVRGLPLPHVGHIAFTERIELHELSGQRYDLEQLFFALTAPGTTPSPAPPGTTPSPLSPGTTPSLTAPGTTS